MSRPHSKNDRMCHRNPARLTAHVMSRWASSNRRVSKMRSVACFGRKGKGREGMPRLPWIAFEVWVGFCAMGGEGGEQDPRGVMLVAVCDTKFVCLSSKMNICGERWRDLRYEWAYARTSYAFPLLGSSPVRAVGVRRRVIV